MLKRELKYMGMDASYYLVGELTALSNRFQTFADTCFEDISWKQCFVLICIKISGHSPTINELSAMLGSSHQNVKQLLLKLEKAGYIEFLKDETDKRKLRIIRTKKAEAFDAEHAEKSGMYMRRFFQGIDKEKLQATIETLTKLEENLKEMEDEYEGFSYLSE